MTGIENQRKEKESKMFDTTGLMWSNQLEQGGDSSKFEVSLKNITGITAHHVEATCTLAKVADVTFDPSTGKATPRFLNPPGPAPGITMQLIDNPDGHTVSESPTEIVIRYDSVAAGESKKIIFRLQTAEDSAAASIGYYGVVAHVGYRSPGQEIAVATFQVKPD